jgi:dihydrofolate reductase
MTCKVYIATSLDGYIADKDHNIDWLMQVPNPSNDDLGFTAFMDNIDALIMGSNTFKKILSLGEWIYTKPVYVMSGTIKEIPSHLKHKAFLIKGSIEEVLTYMETKKYTNLYIDGGQMIQSFLAKDLIDEMIITTIPILLGEGIPLFGNTGIKKFKLITSEVLLNQLVKSGFKRAL